MRILEAAKKLFVQEGYEATSIRKIAKEIEFSPTTIYLYYKDKNDIMYALHKEGFTMLREKFQVLMSVEHPYERLKAIGKTYIEFGLHNPEFYEVMFIMKEPMAFIDSNCAEDEWPEGQRVFDFLEQTISDCQEMGYFKGMPAQVLALQAWLLVHGLVCAYISRHLIKLSTKLNPDIEVVDLVNHVFQSYVYFLEKTK